MGGSFVREAAEESERQSLISTPTLRLGRTRRQQRIGCHPPSSPEEEEDHIEREREREIAPQ